MALETRGRPQHPVASPSQWALLGRLERIAFRLAAWITGRVPRLVELWHQVLISPLAWLCIGRRRHVIALDELGLGRADRVIMVANHRSFFDFFVVTGTLRWGGCPPRRVLFPVRSRFFYDNPFGVLINLVLSGMTMFPPIARERSRSAFNRYAMARIVSELEVPGTIVGLHPEGTRNKGADPYTFLRAQPGVGKVVLEAAEDVRVVPVFLVGVSNNLLGELVKNWTAPRRHPVYVVYGSDIDFADLRAAGSRAATQKKASDRCLDAIRELAAQQRARAEGAAAAADDGDDPPRAAAG